MKKYKKCRTNYKRTRARANKKQKELHHLIPYYSFKQNERKYWIFDDKTKHWVSSIGEKSFGSVDNNNENLKKSFSVYYVRHFLYLFGHTGAWRPICVEK